jgi:hypothetical protein
VAAQQSEVPAVVTNRSRFTGVSGRIIGTVLLTGLVALVVGVVGLWGIRDTHDSGDALYSQAMAPAQEVAAIREAFVQSRFDSLSAATASSEQMHQQSVRAREAGEQRLRELSEAYGRRELSSAERTSLEEFQTTWQD